MILDDNTLRCCYKDCPERMVCERWLQRETGRAICSRLCDGDYLWKIEAIRIELTIAPAVLYKIGLALENGCDDKQMRVTWGDETIDWLKEAMRDPVWLAYAEELQN